MKKITLIALLFALNWQANAQNSDISLLKRNELKLDVAYLIGGALKVEYEYLLTDYSSLGISTLYNFDTRKNEWEHRVFKAQILGTYRLYFGKEPVAGFFLEGNMGLIHGEYRSYHRPSPSDPRSLENYAAFGIGIALGWKLHIPKSGIVLDIFGGVGRKFGAKESDEQDGWGYPRVGICVGKRF